MTLFRSGLFAALLGITFAGTLFAPEGHVHADAAPPPTVQTAPRATAASPLFELVALANGTGRVVSLDRFETNAPVIGALVDVENLFRRLRENREAFNRPQSPRRWNGCRTGASCQNWWTARAAMMW